MKTKKYIGIWLDHAEANLIELTSDEMISNKIESAFTHEAKENSLTKSENLMHNKEQHQQLAYYKKISQVIKDYSGVLLFGPTTAKNELSNLLKEDHHFAGIKIEVMQADKMTENQQHAFVRNYFHAHNYVGI